MTRRITQLQDEVYRQMLRVEAGCPSAELCLAAVLLRAWLALERNPPGSGPREWLRTVCPVCLKMIEAGTFVLCAEPCKVDNERVSRNCPGRSRSRHA